ncbi:hypothetical protein GCM10010112_69420 [Actinoplanes lobatus]|uniref:Integral membrane protein n=1 Tax=Actinoplanes lobatus TaxID=113568 RepID=A0A7W7HM36_9ACTN|nr:hypothetical protein [Actinoplanes lobatus]MBB4753081.1 hypothetical protein [Actinoplanes lobatus]GGN87132.1 hypothetical protein GCM10010112_69420 [Actinoplanes lobatus]GIE39688.1 hypothetical protein Alo02nite_25860 [Actinoplanes lobatus]
MAVTELRVHGVGGARPDVLLGTPSHRQVWGDRLAGFYAAEAEQRGRRIEAYCWGGMTSRSSTRVLWLLLFPFMIANLAGWTCSARTRADRWAFAAHRACGRLAALGITLNLLLIIAIAAMDCWAFQFGGRPGDPSAPQWRKIAHGLVDRPEAGQRVVLGAGVVAAVLLILWLLSQQARNRYEEVAPATDGGGYAAALAGGVTDPRFFDGADTVRRLSLLHVSAGLSWLAFLLSRAPWSAAAAGLLLGCSIVLLVCESAGDRAVMPLAVAAMLAVCVTAGQTWTTNLTGDGHLPNMRATAIGTLALIMGLVVVRAPILAGIALLRWVGIRRGAATATVPRPVRPWPGAPLVVSLLALLSANVAGMGILVGAVNALGPGVEMFPLIEGVLPMLTLAPVALFIGFPLVQLIRYAAAGHGPGPAVIRAEYAGRADATAPVPPPWDAWRCSALPTGDLGAGERRRRMRWLRSVARGRELAEYAFDVRYLFDGLAAIAVLALVLAWLSLGNMVVRYAFTDRFAVWVAGLIPVAGVALLRWGWGRRDARRWLGVLWDVGTFWPRSFHPFAPPCYSERAVPDIHRRIRWLNDNGDRVLLVAHSQGSVLAAVALAQLPPGRAVLATFGSPLMKLYGWAFPAYINDRVLAGLRDWRNFSYPTDYIGGPVGRADVDVPLPDPESVFYTAGEPMPRMRRHTGYWSDEAMWQQIDQHTATAGGQRPDAERLAPSPGTRPS